MDDRDRLASIPSWSSGSPAGFARAMGATDWPRRGGHYARKLSLAKTVSRCVGSSAELRTEIVYLPDLEQPRPPDLPPGLVKVRLVKNT